MPYWDRTPYVEFAADGTPTYVEHHRTLGDRVREIAAAGFRLVDFVEPEWPAGHTEEWGQWSPLRGAILPGTAIYVCEMAADALPCRMITRPATRTTCPNLTTCSGVGTPLFRRGRTQRRRGAEFLGIAEPMAENTLVVSTTAGSSGRAAVGDS